MGGRGDLRSRGEEAGHGILTTCMGADGSQAIFLLMPAAARVIPRRRIGQRELHH